MAQSFYFYFRYYVEVKNKNLEVKTGKETIKYIFVGEVSIIDGLNNAFLPQRGNKS